VTDQNNLSIIPSNNLSIRNEESGTSYA